MGEPEVYRSFYCNSVLAANIPTCPNPNHKGKKKKKKNTCAITSSPTSLTLKAKLARSHALQSIRVLYTPDAEDNTN